MSDLRELLKQTVPPPLKEAFIKLRHGLAAVQPIEQSALHSYEIAFEPESRPRLTLIIPTIAPHHAFGGVVTGLDVFLALGAESGADLRLVLDTYGAVGDRSVLDKRARVMGLDPERISVVPRRAVVPRLGVRRNDVFLTYNTWITLNIRPVLREQARHFGVPVRPYLHLIQDYEPLFYAFSSSHMLALQGFERDRATPKWAIVNTHELADYMQAQGHTADHSYVLEPQVSEGLRPFLDARPGKRKRILVYGRPGIPRNCYPAILSGLKLWARRYPQFAGWEVVSAGAAHRPVALEGGREIKSVGKLPLSAYASYLGTTAVGLSLMSSPHPSYPPLEMAHFGVLTVTNSYANKDLSTSHENILSIRNIDAETIAGALAEACSRFEAAPDAGWQARSLRPSFLANEPYPFVAELAAALKSKVWGGATREARPQSARIADRVS